MILSRLIAFSVIAAMAFASAPAYGATAPAASAGYTFVKTEGEISEYRLDSNGLTVLLLPDHSAPAVTVLVTYHVGSRNESYGTTGATHLLEHLMFKGTQAHNQQDGNGFDQLLERTGAITNATTSLDRTDYFETVGSQDLPLAIALESDRMRNLRLRENDRRPEMTVVRNEYERGENDPAEALEKEIRATAFLAHPYHHTTIGWRSDFEKVPIEKLRAFYDTYYWPNNATVTIIGDFDTATALGLVKQNYGKIPRSPQPIPEVYTEEPPQTGPRRVTVKRPGELGVVMMAQKIPPASDADYAALRVLSMILSDGRNSRFYQALTDKNLTTEAEVYPEFHRDPSLLIVEAQLAPNSTHADVEERLLKEVARVQQDGVKEDEVAAAIAKYTASTAFERDGSMAMAFALNECIAVNDWPQYYRLQDAVKKVTAADVERVAKKYFDEDQRTTGWYIPRDEKPAEEAGAAAKSAAEGNSGAEKPAAQGDSQEKAATAAGGDAHAASPSKSSEPGGLATAAAPPAAEIAPRIVRKKVQGIDLLVCPTGVKDVVTIKGEMPVYDASSPILGELAAEMLERGTAKHDAQEIASLLDKVGAQIDFKYDSGSVKFVVRSLKKDSADVIALLAEQLREPSFPSEEFDKLQKQKLAEAQQMRDDTDTQASIAFRRAVFSPSDPQYRLTSDERITALKQATVADVKAFQSKSFGPDHATMVAVGDVEASAVQAHVEKAFAGWKGGRALPSVPAIAMLKEASEQTVTIPGKESVSVIAGAPTGLHFSDPDYLPLDVATDVLGHGFTSRLLGTVRDKEGLTYTIQADLVGSGQLEQAWLVYASYAPSLLKQGTASTRREVDQWHRDGITAAELDYRKSALAGEHRVKMATSGGMADMILNTVRRGLPLSWIDEYPKQVSALTLKQVNEVVRRRVDPEKLVTVRAGTVKSE